MCLIAVKELGADLPKDEHLKNGASNNSDGCGIAFWKNNTSEIMIKKDFENVEKLLEFIHSNIKREDACIIHFRQATSGLVDIGNRHPFPITKNKELLRKPEVICKLAVAHNGVLSNYGSHKKYSDTQKFILDILAEDSVKNNLESEAIRKLINAFLGNDKLAILNSQGTIYLFGDFEKEKGIYYSNYSYGWASFFKKGKYDYYAGYEGFGCYREDYEKEIENGLTNQKQLLFNNKSKNEGFYAKCEGCFETKYVIAMEVKEQIYFLCKSCRKKVRKGKLEIKIKPEPKLYLCESCEREVETVFIFQGFQLCKLCYDDMKKEFELNSG